MTSTPSGAAYATPSGSAYVTPSSPMATPYSVTGDTSAPGYISSSSPAFSPTTGTAAPKGKPSILIILLILGIAAVILGGVTVTIVAIATGAFSSSSDRPSSGSSSSGGLIPASGPTNNQPLAGNTLRVGQPVTGTLAVGQQLDYPLQITQARMVAIDLQSSAFDTYLYLLQGQMELMRDDDGGDGLNSRIMIYLAPGSYTVRVGSYGNSGGGPFMLSIH